jgi:hypothetical protein
VRILPRESASDSLLLRDCQLILARRGEGAWPSPLGRGGVWCHEKSDGEPFGRPLSRSLPRSRDAAYQRAGNEDGHGAPISSDKIRATCLSHQPPCYFVALLRCGTAGFFARRQRALSERSNPNGRAGHWRLCGGHDQVRREGVRRFRRRVHRARASGWSSQPGRGARAGVAVHSGARRISRKRKWQDSR